MSRPDLLALDDDKLAALANRGLVKRSRKDLAAGGEYSLEVSDEGLLILQRDGVETRLPAGVPLAESDCSCGSRKICRHRIFAVLAYQERGEQAPVEDVAWDPGTFSDQQLEELVGSRTLKRARTLMTKGMQVQLRAGPPPTALLPTCTVTFLVVNSLAYARCDCIQESACEHIPLAVWAFRAGQEQALDRVELGNSEARGDVENLDLARAVVEELLCDGVVNAAGDLEPRLERVARALQKQGLVWMSDLTEELAESLKAYAGRYAAYSSQAHGRLLTEWLARQRAAKCSHAELTPACVLGVGEPPETALEHIRLTSLGARVWADADSEHAEIYLADPDTSTVLVLSKRWARSEQPIRSRSVLKGVRLDSLAAGQLVTKAAKRRANRTLMVGRSRVAQSAVFAQKGEWRELLREPLYCEDYGVLWEALTNQGPAILRARVRAEQVVVLVPDRVEGLHYDPAEQQVRATLVDRAEQTINLVSEFNPLVPDALDVLYQELEAGPRYISGHLSFRGGGLTLTPLALVSDRMVVPAFETTDRPEMTIATLRRAENPVLSALERTLELLASSAHQGLKYLPKSWPAQAKLVGEKLNSVGLGKLAEALDALALEPSVSAWTDLSLRLWLTHETYLQRN